MPGGQCSVVGCDREDHTRGWCQAHYFRVLRNGYPGAAKVRPPKGNPSCAVQDCDRTTKGGYWGYCDKHIQRVRSHGDPTVIKPPHFQGGSAHPNWAGAAIKYGAAHERVRNVRGRVRQYPCVRGCGKAAQQWAYDHQDPEELWSEHHGVPYSQHPHHYLAMCIPCHKRFDLDYLEATRGYMMRPPVVRSGISYIGAHARVRASRGVVQQYACVTGCGAQAQQWAYDHRDIDELRDPKSGALYSGAPHHYLAMCIPCHRRFDAEHVQSVERLCVP